MARFIISLFQFIKILFALIVKAKVNRHSFVSKSVLFVNNVSFFVQIQNRYLMS